MKSKNFTVVYTLPESQFPLAFTTFANTKVSAARTCVLNHPSAAIFAVVALPSKAPAKFKVEAL